ncbi:MAG: bifunctional hydroxymethylpyrimidine kinase/phosphomethylpyrimidine kinase [Beijerinckiaceae bacterium]
MTPIAVTIAGSDSGGGAGIQADLKTFSALGVYGASVLVALTAQNTVGVQAIHDVPPDFVAEQIDSVFSDFAVSAVKIGMVSNALSITAIASGLLRYSQTQVVLDPVMVATSGDRLLRPDAINVLRERLMPLARLITPNMLEAAALLDEPVAASEGEMVAQARRLLRFGSSAVLVKGGHGTGIRSNDVFVTAGEEMVFPALRVATRNTHGTGCTLSAAIAAGLAKGLALKAAVADAKTFLTGALEAGAVMRIGKGRGPVHHFYRHW